IPSAMCRRRCRLLKFASLSNVPTRTVPGTQRLRCWHTSSCWQLADLCVDDMSTGQALVTAEEFKQIALERDGLVDLVRGRVVELHRTGVRHGCVCVQVAVPLLEWVKQVHGGYVMTNNVGIQTQHNPDTVRGPDVIFVRKSRLP